MLYSVCILIASKILMTFIISVQSVYKYEQPFANATADVTGLEEELILMI